MTSTTIISHPTPRAARRRSARRVILAAWLLVLVPVVIKEIPREQARWKRAAADVHLRHNDIDKALAKLRQAARLDPDNWRYSGDQSFVYQQLAGIRFVPPAEVQVASAEHLERAFEYLNEAEKKADGPAQIAAVYELRSQLFSRLHRWTDAAAQMKVVRQALEDLTGDKLGEVLNGTAYVRALANVDLDAALADAKEALDLLPDGAEHDWARSQYLDTRGYIYYRRGEFQLALKDLNRAVELYEPKHRKWKQRLAAWPKERVDLSGLPAARRQANRNFATILYHRLLVNTVFSVEDAKYQKAVQLDENRIRRLGFEPTDDLY